MPSAATYPQQALCFALSISKTLDITDIEAELCHQLPSQNTLLQWAIVNTTATHFDVEGYYLT